MQVINRNTETTYVERGQTEYARLGNCTTQVNDDFFIAGTLPEGEGWQKGGEQRSPSDLAGEPNNKQRGM